ncbi:MAG: mechanosensitive ion channel family protein [Halobacteriota archaeon]
MTDIATAARSVGQLVPNGPLQFVASILVVVAILVTRYLVGQWLSRRERELGSSQRLVVSGVVALSTALGVMVLIGIWGLLDPLIQSFESLGVEQHGGEVILSIVLLGGAYALTNFVGRVIQELTESRGHLSSHQREIVYRLTQVTLYGLVGLTIISLFTRDLSSLLVGAGFLGIVVGMASRQTLGAMLSGFVLMFSRPFEIGDWVRIDDKEGVVTEITVVNTRLQTVDGEYVMLPNDMVSASAIVNRTRKGRLRIEVEVGVDYGDDPQGAGEVALDAVSDIEQVLDVPTPRVVAKEFADSAVVLGIRVWIDKPSARRKWTTQTAVVEAVKAAFEDEGIKIPYPQRELTGRPTEDGVESGYFDAEAGRAGDAETPADENASPTTDGGERTSRGDEPTDGEGQS